MSASMHERRNDRHEKLTLPTNISCLSMIPATIDGILEAPYVPLSHP